MFVVLFEFIHRDRKQFSTRVFDVASTDLVNMGIMIISYTIKDITDDVGYLSVSTKHPPKIQKMTLGHGAIMIFIIQVQE